MSYKPERDREKCKLAMRRFRLREKEKKDFASFLDYVDLEANPTAMRLQ